MGNWGGPGCAQSRFREAVLKHVGEQKAGHEPWLCGHQSRADLRLLLEASESPGLDFYSSQSQTPICSHPTPAPSATHTLHTRHGSTLRGAESTC